MEELGRKAGEELAKRALGKIKGKIKSALEVGEAEIEVSDKGIKARAPSVEKAKELLDRKKLEFTEIDITNDNDKKMEMFERSGKVSVPQIFFGDRHIGGFDDLNELENKGELDQIKMKKLD